MAAAMRRANGKDLQRLKQILERGHHAVTARRLSAEMRAEA